MGGTAIKTITTRRYSVEEYERLLPEILDMSKGMFSKMHPTTYFKSKDSFGDMDILCLIDKEESEYIELIKNTFNPRGISKNHNVISFEYKDLQIDFILTIEENWETSKIYYSYNDLSQYIGKIANQFGLKFGVEGFKYKVGNVNVIITKDHNLALQFLGFNSDRYNKGFDSMDEIYEFVMSSKYFHPDFFKLENLSKVQQERDSRRKNYMRFLELMELSKVKKPFFYPDPIVYLGKVEEYFPGFLENLHSITSKLQSEKERQKEKYNKIYSLYNGLILKEKLGISSVDLGLYMMNFREFFGSKDLLDDYIYSTDNQETIIEKFKEVNKLK